MRANPIVEMLAIPVIWFAAYSFTLFLEAVMR